MNSLERIVHQFPRDCPKSQHELHPDSFEVMVVAAAYIRQIVTDSSHKVCFCCNHCSLNSVCAGYATLEIACLTCLCWLLLVRSQFVHILLGLVWMNLSGACKRDLAKNKQQVGCVAC